MTRVIPVDSALEAGYNVRLLVDDFDGLIQRWSQRSEQFRQQADATLDCQYGEGEKDRLDVFRCGKENAPLFVFIHGGYWQRGDKSAYSYVAEPFVNSGVDVALIGYQLCPAASMTGIVNKISDALVWLWRNAEQLGICADRLNLSGHSAGGHITGMILATDWVLRDQGVPSDLIKSAIPISGLYQLEPIRQTTIADALGLDDEESQALSPHFFKPATSAPILVTLGGGETPQFHWQTDQYQQRWQQYHAPMGYHAEPDVDHFGVVEKLADPQSAMFKKTRAWLR